MSSCKQGSRLQEKAASLGTVKKLEGEGDKSSGAQVVGQAQDQLRGAVLSCSGCVCAEEGNGTRSGVPEAPRRMDHQSPRMCTCLFHSETKLTSLPFPKGALSCFFMLFTVLLRSYCREASTLLPTSPNTSLCSLLSPVPPPLLQEQLAWLV